MAKNIVSKTVMLQHHHCLVALSPRVSVAFGSGAMTTVVDMGLDLFCEALERMGSKTQITNKGHMTAQI